MHEFINKTVMLYEILLIGRKNDGHSGSQNITPINFPVDKLLKFHSGASECPLGKILGPVVYPSDCL